LSRCACDKSHAEPVFKKYPKAQQFTHYRQMLDQMKDIDGASSPPPIIHHAFAAMEAIQRRQHVYARNP